MGFLTRRNILYFALVLFIGISLLITLHHHEEIKNEPTEANQMDSFMTVVFAKNFNKNGQLQNTLTTPSTSHYPEHDTTLVTQPYLVAQGSTGPAWHISADHGKLTNGTTRVDLWGNVKIVQPPGDKSHDITLLTSAIIYYPDQRFAETDRRVTIIQPGTVIHSIGMTTDLNKGVVKLLHQTQGQYDKSKAHH